MANKKRIEKAAINALEAVLLRCPILESFIESNDKTPSWDGSVFVHTSDSNKKNDILGIAPVQVKGTEKEFVSNKARLSCEVTDLKNYYMNGGCIFFLISLDTSKNASNIYYSSLQVYDLKKILDKAGRQKTIRITLDKFPCQDINEIATIFISFVENKRRQTSFIDKEINTFEQLVSKGVNIESISFNTSRLGLNIDGIGSFISSHDLYLYAKPKGIDVEIPVDKVSNAIVFETVCGEVSIRGKEHYPQYNILHKNGNSTISIGKSISMAIEHQDNKLSVNFKPTGTLDEVIQDAACFVDMIDSQEITLGKTQYKFSEISPETTSKYKSYLQFYKDVKKTIDFLGVTEELQCQNLSKKDSSTLVNLVNTVIYNRTIGLPGAQDALVYGMIKIANLSILIWAIKQDDGFYKVTSFSDFHKIVVFEKEDMSIPIQVSQYLLLNKEAFIFASNIDYEKVKDDICSMRYHPLVRDYVAEMLLDVLHAYDEQNPKDDRLLELAETICEWLALNKDEEEVPFIRINQLQINKRRRALTIKERTELEKYTHVEYHASIRCGAFLLLEKSADAQKCFDLLSLKEQKEFITYPICYFGKLVISKYDNQNKS